MNKPDRSSRGRVPRTDDPAGFGQLADAAGVDDISGVTATPISVWRTARRRDDPAQGIGARLAYRLVATYTAPGDVIVDVTGGHRLAGYAGLGARVHHPARFTDDDGLVIDGPTSAPAKDATGTAHGNDPTGDAGGEQVPDIAGWFGDDLTDPYPPPTTRPDHRDAVPDGLRRATGLVVATWPLHQMPPVHEARLARLLNAGTALLRPNGCLVLVVGADGPDPGCPSGRPIDFTPLIDTAHRAGLTYLQHIVAVVADTDGDRFTYYLRDEELLALAHDAGQPWSAAHIRVHADLIVFAHHRAGGARHA